MRAPPKKTPGPIALALALALALVGASSASSRPAVAGSAAPSAHVSIVNGVAAEAGTFPWLAVIFHEGEGESFQCTGTVVSPNVVLTAAHCVEDPRTGNRYTAAGYFVVTGTVDWTLTPRQVLGVSTTVVYPAFNRLYASGDAALLVLSTPTTAPALPLATAATDAAFLAPGHHVVMAGWGETFPGGPVPHELHWAGTAVQSPRFCHEHTRVYVPSEELCTLDSPAHHTVACFGDSGGPLLGALPATGEVVELGVASHLFSDCQPTSPVVYTRADLVSTWVHDWISSASFLPGTVTPASTTRTVANGTPSSAATPGRLQRPARRRPVDHPARCRQRRMDHRSRGHGAGLMPSGSGHDTGPQLAGRSAVHLRRRGRRGVAGRPRRARAGRHGQAHRPASPPRERSRGS